MDTRELDRLQTLQEAAILDTPAEEAFDRLAALAAEIFEAPIALISLVDADRQWFKARVGLDACSTSRDSSFCAYAIKGGPSSVMVVENAATDPRFKANPMVTGEPNIRFYAGAVLTSSSGRNLGTVCVIDRKKRPAPPRAKLDMLQTLARICVDEIELRRAQRDTEAQRLALEKAKALIGFGRWRLDLSTGVSTWSDSMYEIYGVDRATFQAGIKGVSELIAPEDRGKMLVAVEGAIANRSGFELEIHINRPDGGTRCAVSKAVCELGADGAPIALFGVLQDVTDRDRALHEARDQAQRAELAERLAGVGHWRMDAETRELAWSPQMYAIYGIRPDQPLALEPLMAMTDGRDRAQRVDALQRLLATGQAPGQQITRIRRLNGELRYVRTDMAAERGPDGKIIAAVGTLLDITDQRRVQLELARSEARYKLLADNSSDLILQCDETRKITYASPSCLEITGRSVDSLIGSDWLDLIKPEERERTLAAIHDQIRAGAVHALGATTYCVVHDDGRVLQLEGRPTLMFDMKTGQIKGMTCMLRDVTERTVQEAELRHAHAAAEAAAASKAAFLANMSHELRTPMTAILGFAELIRSQPELSEVTRDYLDRVTTGGEALLATVNDILDFSKLEAGQVEIKREPCDVADIATQVMGLFVLQAERKELVLEVEGLDELPERLIVDPGRVRQILLNLVGNALKFTEEGSVRLTAGYDRKTKRLRMTVIDTGPGVDPDNAQRLFRRFSQLDGPPGGHPGGTGLGLAICKGLAEAMGGEIGLDSRPGEGSSFWFAIPAEPAAAASRSKAAIDAAPIPPGLRVLVADDNPANRALVGAVLSAYGATAVEASDGAEAVHAAMQTPFDVILMDLRMPNLDGAAAAGLIRAEDGPNSTTPLIAFSADVTSDLPEGLFDGQVAKPITVAALTTALSQAVRERTDQAVEVAA